MMKESITWVHNGTVEISNHETQTSSNRKLQTISPSPGVGLNNELLGHSSGQSFLRYIYLRSYSSPKNFRNKCTDQNSLDKKCFAYHNNKSVSCLESILNRVLNRVRVTGRPQTLHNSSFTGTPIERKACSVQFSPRLVHRLNGR